MRILIVNSHVLDIPGGSETQCHDIALRLAELGHAVTYAVCRPGRQTYDVPYKTYPLRGSLPAAFAAALTQVEPDIVYWRRNKRYLLRSVFAAKRRHVKFVFAVSAGADVKMFNKRQLLANDVVGLLRRLWRRAAAIGTTFTGMANHFALSLVDGVVFQHSGQIPPGFRGTSRIIYNSRQPLEATPAPSSAPYVLWVGNLKTIKHPEHFIRLAAELPNIGVEFWMAGGIQDAVYARMLNDRASLPGSFRYLGAQSPDEVDSLIKGSLFLVSTSAEEGFPNVFIQAWLQRRTVVSLSFDPGNMLVTEKIGLCSGSHAAFKHDVSRLVADRALRESTGERAFQFAIANCDPETNVRRLEAFLIEVASAER
ncbi:MAG: glycosyltransferase family 4 protein [Gammaproteobacteria bacterium]